MTDPVKIIVGEGDITEVQVPEYGIIQTGGGGGGGGSDGATFFPEVSQEGVISWTNDGGYDNPEPVNIKGAAGNDGSDGEDGVTFIPSVSDAGIISWTNDGDLPNPSPVNIKGSDGEDGEDGVSPAVTFGTITGGHTMTVTDKTHPTGQTINIMDGAQGQTGPGVPAGGTTGQVLAKSSNTDYATTWVNAGGGGTSDYDDLTDKPSINGTTLSGNKTAADLGLGTYSKPSTGIPKSDLASDVQTSLGKADSALQSVPSTYRTAAAQDAIDAAQNGNLAMIESSPATAAHAVGEYIVLNGQLYKVTAAIAAGQTLTVGTNIEAVSSGGLNALKNALSVKSVQVSIGDLPSLTPQSMTGTLSTPLSHAPSAFWLGKVNTSSNGGGLIIKVEAFYADRIVFLAYNPRSGETKGIIPTVYYIE